MREVVVVGVDIIMFDNCMLDEIWEFLKIVLSVIVIEVLGGIIIEDLLKYGKIGVDYILFGVLIYLVKVFDISFNIEG